MYKPGKKVSFCFILSLLLILSLVSLVSCSNKKIRNPAEILIDNKKISYTDNKEAVEKQIGSGAETSVIIGNGFEYKDNLQIVYNDEGDIRYIKINDSSIDTYKNISVGDNIDKVTKAFKYETNMGKDYSVLFDGTKEVDPYNENKLDEWLWLNYSVDDNDQIEVITICDVRFGEKFY